MNEGEIAIKALKAAMDDAAVPDEFRAPLIGHYCNHWNRLTGASTQEQPSDAPASTAGPCTTPGHSPEEWGPSHDRRLTCSCGNPDPGHLDKP